ncbi:MAG TPA: tetratricopeptide repeat protein [Steroidobacteraceae bacterium]|nr:tetratricopeptide repeat protein [Steroidobacteraceae bacterium]
MTFGLMRSGQPRVTRGWLAAALLGIATFSAVASPYTPAHEDEVLASLPAGGVHVTLPARQQAAARLDVALPLAQFYIEQGRKNGDLRFLGYAEATLAPWRDRNPEIPAVLVLQATILQSRHEFDAALNNLARALTMRPDDPQGWLLRATVLRVLGRYPEAVASCARITPADPAVASICLQSTRSLHGQLQLAYAALRALTPDALSTEARAWRASELGEMAVRLGEDAAAERWFAQALRLAPGDAYTRAAYADLLLSERRAAETLALLKDYESMEPLLLRIAIAQQQLGDPDAARSRAQLAEAFSVEQQRGESVHRREQARFLLDVVHDPAAAVEAASANWQVQREPADILILLRTAEAAHNPAAAAPALQFAHRESTEDARFAPYLRGAP